MPFPRGPNTHLPARARHGALAAGLVVAATLACGSCRLFAPFDREPAAVRRSGVGRDVPERYAGIVLLAYPTPPKFRNVLYEGHNLALRGPRDANGLYRSGAEAAARWRRAAHRGERLFALRDSMFSQQDHVFRHEPFALMMPTNWVTAALAEVAAGRPIRPVTAPAVDDEDGWRAIEKPRALFGSFPPSPWLHRLATSKMEGRRAARIRHARLSLRSLAADTAAMAAVQHEGADAVAAAGASRIARSDRRYFGARRRRDHVAVIVVENALPAELREAKGPAVPGRPEIPAAVVTHARDAVYRRRLADGDIAIERYDVTRPDDRRRAIAVLAAIVPRSGPPPGGLVWLWITGTEGVNGTRFAAPPESIAAFRRELAAADVDLSRVRLLPRPSLKLPDDASRARVFEEHVDWFRAVDLPLGVRVDSTGFDALIAPSASDP